MSQVNQLELQLDAAKELIRRRQLALRLATLPEFKELILDDFMVKECARYVHASSDPALKAEERADALNMAQAAGHLKRYLSVVVQMGAHSEREIGSLEEAIAEARVEEESRD